MSGSTHGGAAGRWLASDGNWYPPDMHPDALRSGASGAVLPAAGANRRALALTMAAIVLVGAAAGTGVAVIGDRSTPATPPPAPAQSPVKAVVASVATTEQARTAHVDLTMHASVTGAGTASGTVTATGAGNIDFADNAAQLALDYSGPGVQGGLAISEIYVGGTAYVSIPQVAQLVPGKSWISVPVVGSSSIDPGSSNPADLLHILASEGNTVTALGPSTIGGVGVQGYHVVVDAGFLRSRIGQLGLSPGEQQALQQILTSSALQFDVFVDGSGQLRRMNLDMSIHAGAGGSSVAAHVEEDFSDYGAAVAINPPPASEVTTLQQVASSGGAPA
ncbi:MAG TPA: hypothetical protein VMU76_03260 [Acidimicrobiales bacterium]|nr:hypothetical protein [Acidimicrobiales bacterium]